MIESRADLLDYKEEILDYIRWSYRDEVLSSIEIFEKFRDDVLLTFDEEYELCEFSRKIFSNLFYDELLNMGAELDYQVGKYCMVCLSEQFKKELCELILEFYEEGLLCCSDEDDEEI